MIILVALYFSSNGHANTALVQILEMFVCSHIATQRTRGVGLGTVEPLYNEVLGTMKITLLYQVSHYIRVKKL